MKSINFCNVSQIAKKDYVYISFSVSDYFFKMVIHLCRDGLFQPVEIIHHTEKGVCPFCQSDVFDELWCKTLEESMKDVFQHLTEQPAIRLEWLYIPHEDSVIDE